MLGRRQSAAERMSEAKKMFSHAAEATLQGNAQAVALTQTALIEVNAARLALNALADEAETRPF